MKVSPIHPTLHLLAATDSIERIRWKITDSRSQPVCQLCVCVYVCVCDCFLRFPPNVSFFAIFFLGKESLTRFMQICADLNRHEKSSLSAPLDSTDRFLIHSSLHISLSLSRWSLSIRFIPTRSIRSSDGGCGKLHENYIRSSRRYEGEFVRALFIHSFIQNLIVHRSRHEVYVTNEQKAFVYLCVFQ